MKKTITFLLKLLFVAGLLTLLVRKGLLSISLQQTGKALTQWSFIIPALSLCATSTLLGVFRWHLLVRAQGIRISLAKTFELTMVGNFFNIALPGAVSGDVVKAFYVGREAKGARARAFGSILFDRIVGLAAMVIVAAGALALGYSQFKGSALLGAVRVFLTTAALGFLVFFGYLFFLNEKRDIFLILARKLERRWHRFGSLVRIYEGIREYHHHRGTVAAVLGISVIVQSILGLATYFFAGALDESSIPLIAYYVVVPLGMLVTAVPLLPGGVGTGHAAFGFLFSLLGSQRGADVFTLNMLYNVSMGAVGGLIYLRFKSSPHFTEIPHSARIS